MNRFLFDASALVKRYFAKAEAALVDHLFAQAAQDRLACLMLGVAEVAAVLVRKRNRGLITSAVLAASMTKLRTEVAQAPAFLKIPAENALIEASLPLLERHAINATDAILLRAALDLAAQFRTSGDDLVLLAADKRLLRAAQAEGLPTFDPETQPQADLDTLLNS